MVRRIACAVALCALIIPATGCLVAPVMPPLAPVMPPPGMLFTDYKAPLDHNLEGNPIGSRSGTSETMSILSLVALGDGSVAAAAQNGGLSRVHHADYEYFNVLGIYQRYRTVAYGE